MCCRPSDGGSAHHNNRHSMKVVPLYCNDHVFIVITTILCLSAVTAATHTTCQYWQPLLVATGCNRFNDLSSLSSYSTVDDLHRAAKSATELQCCCSCCQSMQGQLRS
jgi:hypothetical protein